ncbi:MAG: HAD-IIIC family phosphatase, partial [Prevotellaceae bacterium]|nr:HAD-IIIC family phosphatase [Candidatus Faecinaster equi]
WDLDETFWDGTLSDNSDGETISPISENIKLVKTLTDRGIVNAVCSKNNKEDAEKKLAELGVLEYFVFNSINWDAKGNRVAQLIKSMALRPANVLFIDDNKSNINEVEFFSPDIFTALPEFIPEIISCADTLGKDDSSHRRLQQYKILETKRNDEALSSSNIDFLRSSEIKICIKTENLVNEAERIEELIQRSNQLNFTKKRIDLDEVLIILNDSQYLCGTVSASDKYGSYGMVGFFAVKDQIFEHFLFSCRTMGMGIEQYIYAQLGYPQLNIVGDVSASVSKEEMKPDYITEVATLEEDEQKRRGENNVRPKVLLKGPCDLEVMRVYLADGDYDIETEFNFVDSRGNQADFYNHSIQILNSKLDKNKQNRLTRTYSFITPETFDTTLFSGIYDVVCLSPLMDATLAVYKEIASNQEIAFGVYNAPLTDSAYWESYINKKVMTAKVNISLDEIKSFCENVEHVQYTAAQVSANYCDIVSEILKANANTKILIILLPELKYENTNQSINYTFEGKEIIHKEINKALKDTFAKNRLVSFLDINKYVKRQSDYFDHINHFSKMVYFNLAQDFVSYLQQNGVKAKTRSTIKAVVDDCIRRFYKKFIYGSSKKTKIFRKLTFFHKKR